MFNANYMNNMHCFQDMSHQNFTDINLTFQDCSMSNPMAPFEPQYSIQDFLQMINHIIDHMPNMHRFQDTTLGELDLFDLSR